MIDRITVGAAAVMGSLAAATGLARWAVRPPASSGRHRAGFVPLADLMPDWPEPVFGAAAPQGFRHCRVCRSVVPVVLHPGAYTCEQGHVTRTGGAR